MPPFAKCRLQNKSRRNQIITCVFSEIVFHLLPFEVTPLGEPLGADRRSSLVNRKLAVAIAIQKEATVPFLGVHLRCLLFATSFFETKPLLQLCDLRGGSLAQANPHNCGKYVPSKVAMVGISARMNGSSTTTPQLRQKYCYSTR